METVRRGLVAQVVGRRIQRVEVGRERTVRRTSAQAVIDGLTGATITDVRRRGKYLLADLDTGDVLMIHLRMSGRVLIAAVGASRPPHTHVVLHLAGDPDPGDSPLVDSGPVGSGPADAGAGDAQSCVAQEGEAPVGGAQDDPNESGLRARPAQEMWFVDPRTFGEVVVFDPRHAATELPELARLGIDPVTDGLSRVQLTALLHGRARQLKALLLDQHVVAGIGNIYCDEALHLARLRPDRLANTLIPREVGRLHRAIHGVLAEAIEAGGSTLTDTQYVDVDGQGGWFQLRHRVYDRAGQRCLTCGKADIVRIVCAGRSTCFCPRCQH